MFRRLIFVLALAATVLVFGGAAFGVTTSDRIEVITDQIGYFPCMDCHKDQASNPVPRIMEEEHSDPVFFDDESSVRHRVTFGERVAIADLLVSRKPGNLRSDEIAKIGAIIGIKKYMEFNGLSPQDSVWAMLHGGGNIWCLNCHDAKDRDKLVKLNGELLTFNQSQLLCGECHGPILTDWELGIHGKTTGFWDPALDKNSRSVKKLCVECHNPHAPAFPPMTALPPPVPRLPRHRVQEAVDHE